MNEIADALLSLHSEGLTKVQNKGYVVLERKITRSNVNKNAVSLIREGISFMVPDFQSFEQGAAERKLSTERNPDFDLRLTFTNLRLSDVLAHQDFFVNLLRSAKLQSEHLQSERKAARLSRGAK